MTDLAKSIRWHAWAAIATGLLAGWFCRDAMQGEVADGKDAVGRTGQTRASRPQAVPKTSPTALFLKETAGIPASRCEELFREICTQKGSRDAIRLEGVFRRWMELEDPKDLLARLAAEKEIPRSAWSHPFFEAWAAVDYQAAMAGTAKDGEFSQIRTLVAIRRRDPSFLNNFLRSLNAEGTDALVSLGQNDPELARQVATFQGKPDNNTILINAVAAGWATQDSKAAFDWVKSLGLSDNYQKTALERILSEWVKSDLTAATEAFKSSTVAESAKISGISDRSLLVLASPEAAHCQIFNSSHLDPFLDLAGLYDQLSKAPIDWDKPQFTTPPIDSDGWISADPARAAEEATRLPAGKARDYLMSCICGQWADRDPEAAIAFANHHSLPKPVMREELPAEVVRAALASPEETFAPLFSKGGETDQKLTTLAQRWAAAEPQTAGEWLIAQMDLAGNEFAAKTTSRVMYLNFFGYYWAKVDAVGSTEWLANLPAGPRKTEVCNAMVSYIEDYSPDLAFTVSANSLEGEMKMRVLESKIQEIAEEIGPPAARELLGTPALNPDERTALGKALDEE